MSEAIVVLALAVLLSLVVLAGALAVLAQVMHKKPEALPSPPARSLQRPPEPPRTPRTNQYGELEE
jgi:hypothetical protein